jgi:FdhD protein
MARSVERSLERVRGAVREARKDRLAHEDPLEIRAQGPGQEPVQIAVTMRTPDDDAELAVGFLFGEGLLRSRNEIAAPVIRELPIEGSPQSFVTVRLTKNFDASRLQRNFYATSSCGICGKAAIDHIHTTAPPMGVGPVFKRSTLISFPTSLRAAQKTFDETGGLHATAAFDRDGAMRVVREDVGRHNAMDKVIGRLLLDDALPLSEGALLVSGRVSFELVQKAAMAQIPLLCAVSAPSSLAVETAERVGMTLVGFLRADGFNIYTRPERIDLEG